MQKKIKLKSLSLLMFTLVALSGCGQPGIIINGNTGTELQFNKISPVREAELNKLANSANQSNTSKTDSSSDSTSSGSVSTSPQAPSAMPSINGAVGRAVSPYYLPQSGYFEQYVVTDYEEARQAGFSGTYLAALDKVVKPIISTLATDARLVSSNGSTDENGINKSINNQQQVPEYSQYQWQFTFTSTSKKEVYNIYISEKETLVLKQTWGILNMNSDSIKIDSNTAINTIKETIKNKDFKSPDGQEINYSAEAEPIAELPVNTTWYFYLQMEKGSLVWNINFSVPYNVTQPGMTDKPLANTIGGASGSSNGTGSGTTTTTAVSYSGGYARIDALTGKILSFYRPVKYTSIYPDKIVPPTPAAR